MQLLEVRLVVEGVHRAGATGHEELDDTSDLRRVVHPVAQGRLTAEEVARHHVRQREAAQSAARLPQEVAAGQG